MSKMRRANRRIDLRQWLITHEEEKARRIEQNGNPNKARSLREQTRRLLQWMPAAVEPPSGKGEL